MRTLFLLLLLTLPAFAQDDEPPPRGESQTDWEAVAKNPLTWICVGVIIFGFLALRELGGIQESVNEVDRINQRQRQILDEDVAREVERQRNWEELNRRGRR